MSSSVNKANTTLVTIVQGQKVEEGDGAGRNGGGVNVVKLFEARNLLISITL